jgi:hypothetical protein
MYPAHPLRQDGDNINNTLEVIPANLSTELIQKQVRLLAADGMSSWLTRQPQWHQHLL